MKQIVFTISILMCFLSSAFAAADSSSTTPAPSQGTKTAVQNPVEKLNRGIANIITSPIEIAKQIDLSWKESPQTTKNAGASIFSGFFKGLGFTFMRMGSGLWDVMTFPFKTPANYEPLMKPEFVLDKEDKEEK